eukprot:UN07406
MELTGWPSLFHCWWVMAGDQPSTVDQFHSNKLKFLFISCSLLVILHNHKAGQLHYSLIVE